MELESVIEIYSAAKKIVEGKIHWRESNTVGEDILENTLRKNQEEKMLEAGKFVAREILSRKDTTLTRIILVIEKII